MTSRPIDSVVSPSVNDVKDDTVITPSVDDIKVEKVVTPPDDDINADSVVTPSVDDMNGDSESRNRIHIEICIGIRYSFCPSCNYRDDRRSVLKTTPKRLAGIPCAIVSYPITKQPIVEADYVDFMITGKVQSSCYPSNLSSNGQRFVRYIPSQDKMLSISLSDQFINLLANQYYEAGLLTVMSMTTFK
ncbi:hypothetical protein QZH41_017700, partial [Actinostola sp. cb2023]